MVEELNPLVEELKKDSRILLFALLKMDELTDRWTVIISGDNLESIEDRKPLFEYVARTLGADTYQETLKKHDVARIGIFPLTNHLVEDLRKYGEDSEIENEKANGNFIHKGHIFINRDVAPASPSPTSASEEA
ncbi:MAG TPA: hypothetical protein VLH86_03270 [Patescibacteria group bacterium]|nr:hypothetical protein [Patescibacteria group bacterium]